MHARLFRVPIAACVLLCAFAPALARAGDNGTGFFRKGESRVDVRHVAAVRHERSADPAEDEIFVYLSEWPMDAARIAEAFDPDDGAREQQGERSGGYVRICLRADEGECGMYYRRRDPDDSFNTSGYGELSIAARDAGRIAGRWRLTEPEDFFGETYEFDLRFDVAVVAPPGAALPEDGGAPGAAYRVYADAVARGDVPALRRMLGESARWRLPDGDDAQVRETLKSLRDGQPLSPTVLRGRSQGNRAVFWVEGRDRDDILRRGQVSMERTDGSWLVAEQSLENVDE